MSLVGTRPILQDELEQYELHHRARIATKPGITGMWQVSGRSNITDFEEVVRLDTEYITNEYCACGQEAGKFLFGYHRFKVIPNAIETDQFVYNEKNRNDVRKKLKLIDKFVIGHVGRLSYQKNHRFLIDIFEELYRYDSNARLLLIGTGEKEKELRDRVHHYGLDQVVYFLGSRDDVNELYQAMDVFVISFFHYTIIEVYCTGRRKLWRNIRGVIF